MDLRNRALLNIVSYDEGADDPEIDIPSLFLHLLFFETVILRSVRLRDIAALVRIIGVPETRELLATGDLKIRLSVDALGATNHDDPTIIELVNIFSADARADSSSAFRDELAPPGLRRPQRQRLKLDLASHYLNP